jgi:hypothetical protein
MAKKKIGEKAELKKPRNRKFRGNVLALNTMKNYFGAPFAAQLQNLTGREDVLAKGAPC